MTPREISVGTPPPDDTWRALLSGANSIRTLLEDTWRALLSGLPHGEAHGYSQTSHPDDSISYPDMSSGSLTKVSKPCYVILTACHNPRPPLAEQKDRNDGK